MLLWFAGTATAAAWVVFSDRNLDWRVLTLGALLPDVIDVPFGGARLGHTLACSVVLLAAVMLGTRGRGRTTRKRLLALPMGTFMHLVFDNAWATTAVFWWPAMGTSFGSARLPSLDRPLAVVAVQEIVGLVALWWALGHFLDTGPAASETGAGTQVEPGC